MAGQSESAATNRHMHKVMEIIAGRMGLDQLPLTNPDIDFYRVAQSVLRKLGFKGQDLDHATYDAIDILVSGNPKKGIEGAIFSYPTDAARRAKDGKPPRPFDRYFMMGVDQKGRRLRETDVRQKMQHGVSITPGKSEELGEGISEESLPGGESAFDEASRADEKAHQERVFAGIPRFLADKRGGDVLVLIWDMLRDNYKLREIAFELNEKGVPTVEGGDWNTGVVSRAKIKIMSLVQQYLQLKGINWNSIESSRFRGRNDRG